MLSMLSAFFLAAAAAAAASDGSSSRKWLLLLYWPLLGSLPSVLLFVFVLLEELVCLLNMVEELPMSIENGVFVRAFKVIKILEIFFFF
jgi:hypothetical protein